MKMHIYIAVLCVCVVFWLIWRWKKISYWKNLGIPGPPPNLLFGNLFELYSKGPLKCHEKWVKKYGRVLGYFYGMEPMLLVADPYLIKKILIEDFNKFCIREIFDPLLPYDPKDKNLQTVINAQGQKWRNFRRILTPAFTSSKLKMMIGNWKSSLKSMSEILREKEQKKISFDIIDIYQKLTVDILTKTFFGIQTDVQQNNDLSILRAIRIFFSSSFRDSRVFIAMTFPFLKKFCLLLEIIVFTIWNKGQMPRETFSNAIENVIKMRRNNSEIKKNDYLQLLLDSSETMHADRLKLKALNHEHDDEDEKNRGTSDKKTKPLKDYEVVSNAMSFLIAGFETTSTMLSFLTYILAKHQDQQEIVYQEIKAIFDKDHELKYDTIKQLNYLDKTICECLRMYPPGILFITRFAVEDVTYEDLYIPKGTLVIVPSYLMHHNPEFWLEPEKFSPERFNDKPNIKRMAYLPFGAGPRDCIGKNFALLEIKLAIATILYNFKIKLDDKMESSFHLLIKLRSLAPSQVIVKLEPRTNDS